MWDDMRWTHCFFQLKGAPIDQCKPSEEPNPLCYLCVFRSPGDGPEPHASPGKVSREMHPTAPGPAGGQTGVSVRTEDRQRMVALHLREERREDHRCERNKHAQINKLSYFSHAETLNGVVCVSGEGGDVSGDRDGAGARGETGGPRKRWTQHEPSPGGASVSLTQTKHTLENI